VAVVDGIQAVVFVVPTEAGKQHAYVPAQNMPSMISRTSMNNRDSVWNIANMLILQQHHSRQIKTTSNE
jgi:hypothetical protein